MKPDQQLQSSSPTFCHWMEGELCDAFSDDRLLELFCDITDLNKADARWLMAYGTPKPVISIGTLREIGDNWAQVRKDEYSWILIHQRIVDAVTRNPQNSRVKLFAKATIMHEMVHVAHYWTDHPSANSKGTYQLPNSRGSTNDAGAYFEQTAFYADGRIELKPEDYQSA